MKKKVVDRTTVDRSCHLSRNLPWTYRPMLPTEGVRRPRSLVLNVFTRPAILHYTVVTRYEDYFKTILEDLLYTVVLSVDHNYRQLSKFRSQYFIADICDGCYLLFLSSNKEATVNYNHLSEFLFMRKLRRGL